MRSASCFCMCVYPHT